MSDASTRRLLVAPDRPESTPRLLDEIERRTRDECDITLMVPPERDPGAPDRTPREHPPDPSGWSFSHGFPDDWVRIEAGPLI